MATQKYLSYHQMWVANHDNNEEGTFINWYNGQVGRHYIDLLLQQLSTKYANVHQLVHWTGWTTMKLNNYLPNMALLICAFLWIANFIQY